MPAKMKSVVLKHAYKAADGKTYPAGETISVPAGEAKRMIALGVAISLSDVTTNHHDEDSEMSSMVLKKEYTTLRGEKHAVNAVVSVPAGEGKAMIAAGIARYLSDGPVEPEVALPPQAGPPGLLVPEPAAGPRGPHDIDRLDPTPGKKTK